MVGSQLGTMWRLQSCHKFCMTLASSWQEKAKLLLLVSAAHVGCCVFLATTGFTRGASFLGFEDGDIHFFTFGLWKMVLERNENEKCAFNSLTAIRVLAGTKTSRPVGFYSRNSTKSTLNPNTTIPQIWPPWWCRLPLIRRGIYGSARSDTPTLFQRGRAGWWSKRII